MYEAAKPHDFATRKQHTAPHALRIVGIDGDGNMRVAMVLCDGGRTTSGQTVVKPERNTVQILDSIPETPDPSPRLTFYAYEKRSGVPSRPQHDYRRGGGDALNVQVQRSLMMAPW